MCRIAVKEANIPSTALETEENGLIIHITDMTLSMNAHWRYEQKKWSVKDFNCIHHTSLSLSLQASHAR